MDKTRVKLLIDVMNSKPQVKGKRGHVVQIHICRKSDSKSFYCVHSGLTGSLTRKQ